MQQKVFLICKLYLFFIYFSLDNFNYSLKNLQNSSAKVSWNSRKTFAEEKQNLLGFEVRVFLKKFFFSNILKYVLDSNPQ